MSQIISSNLFWQQEQTAQSLPAATLSVVPGRRSGFSPTEHDLLDETGCLFVLEGVIEWGLSVGLHHTDTHYVKKLHPSELSHTRQCDRHDTCSKAWLLRPCVSCWPDSWALKKVCPGSTEMNAQGEEKLTSTLRLGAMLPPTGTTLNTLSLLWLWVSVGCRNKRFWYNIKNLKSINITLVLTFNMVPFFLKQ